MSLSVASWSTPLPVASIPTRSTTSWNAGVSSSSSARRMPSRMRTRSDRSDSWFWSMTGCTSGSGDASANTPRDSVWLTHTHSRPGPTRSPPLTPPQVPPPSPASAASISSEASVWLIATIIMSFSPAPSRPDE
jgi:hypothetical protein